MKRIQHLTLVDDDEVFVFLAKKAIKQTNLVEQVKVFDNGQEALGFLLENLRQPSELPEVILLDLSMPVMDGWQFLHEFTKLSPNLSKKIKIFICSSSISPEEIEMAKEINAVSDFIIKPINKEKMIEVIQKV
ncbi:response regulator [Pleomorphovibrio marinus]|uniref:response regulator n=1 Tax=Pleomorphovibrio marinus TaxID=2164132 RepID=UPI000E0C292C|nr:response regulator [Pleomorphovibrio marinus]